MEMKLTKATDSAKCTKKIGSLGYFVQSVAKILGLLKG